MKYIYKAASPTLPPADMMCHSEGPAVTGHDIEYWLNEMDVAGWELVTHGAKHWSNPDATQDFWIFRRRRISTGFKEK